MRKIKVMHVAQAAGGVERYLYMLLKYLNKDKFENILVCSYDYNREKMKSVVDSFEYVSMHRKIGIEDFKAAREIRMLIKQYRPDIVYAHSSKAGAIARFANIGMNSVSVYNPHGWAFNMRCSKKKKTFYLLIEKAMAIFCNKIICISGSEKQSALCKKVCSEKKLKTIISGVDVRGYEERSIQKIERQKIGIPEDAFIIGMTARISEQKAPDIFIKAAVKIKQAIPQAYFIIVGNGEMEEFIREIALKNHLENSLLITGWVDNPLSYVDLFDVALMLSRWEGFGLALPEYMIAQKPIIATRIDAIPEIVIHQENGLLIEVDNEQEVYEAVIEIYQNLELRKRMVKNGLHKVKTKFDAKRVSKEHEELFEALIK